MKLKVAHKDTPKFNPCCLRFIEMYEKQEYYINAEWYSHSTECPDCGHYIGFYKKHKDDL